MPASPPLLVLPLADRVEQQVLELARVGGGTALGVGLCTIRELERSLFAAASLAPIDDLTAQLVVSRLAPSAATGTAFAEVASEPGFARAFLAVYDDLREGGGGARELAVVARRLAGGAGRRATALARIARAYEETLAARSLVDVAGARLALVGRLAAGCPLPEEVERAHAIECEDVLDLPIARVRVLGALAARGKRVEVRLPELLDRPGLATALEALERVLAESPEIAVESKRYGGGALAALSARLFASGPPAPSSGLRVIQADDPAAEERAIVAAVRARLDEGAPPDDIWIAVRGVARWRQRLGPALEAAGIPWRDRRGPSASEAPPCAIALQLLDLADRALPRSELAALLTSRYVDGGLASSGSEPHIPARRVIELLRAAGSRDDGGDGHAARLAAFASRFAAPIPDEGRPNSALATARTAVRVAERLARLLPALRLPELATVATHARALAAALDALGIPARCRALEERDEGRFARVDAAAAHALARDQAGLRTLGAQSAALVAAARRAGMAEEAIPRARFRDLLAQLLDGATLRARGARGGAVLLLDAQELAGRAVPHLVLAGVVDGQFPLRRPAEPLFDDEARLLMNRAAGRSVFRIRAAEEPLTFALACYAARESLTCTCAARDELGRDSVRSSYLDELCDAAAASPERASAALAPAALDCGTASELLTRAALLASGRAPSPRDPAPGDLLAALRADPALGPRLDGALARAARAAAGPAGRLTSDGAIAIVRDALARAAAPYGDRVAWAASASSIDRYAACPFRYFADKHLALPEPEPLDDDLDPRERGTVMHEVARAAFSALKEAGLLPLVGGARAAEERATALAATDAALDGWQARARTGPAALWALRREQARAQIVRLLEAEAARRDPLLPIAFEVGFGSDGAPPLLLPSPDGSAHIAVRGRVDRLDASDGAVAVIDYKSGRVTGKLRGDAIARTHFQLPLYAVWARAQHGLPADAALCSLRDGERSPKLRDVAAKAGLDVEALLALDPATRAAARESPVAAAVGARDLDGTTANVADRAWALFEALRAGRFDVRPHDPVEACSHCRYATVCRVDPASVT